MEPSLARGESALSYWLALLDCFCETFHDVPMCVYVRVYAAAWIYAYTRTDRPRMERESLLLAYDSLASFLRELDDSDDAFASPPVSSAGQSDSCDSPASLSDAVALPRPKRRKPKPATRRIKEKHSDRLKELRGEIQALYRQLKRLQLDPNGNANWKQRAISQRLARDRAEYDNEYLKQRLAEGTKLREEVRRLLVKQQEMLPRRGITVQYSLVDDDSHAFGLLRANLSKRQHMMEITLQSRVRQITQQCLNDQFRQTDDQWNLVAHGKSLRLEVEETSLVPFNAAMVNAAICQYTQSGSIQVAGDDVCGRYLVQMRRGGPIDLCVA